VALRECEAETRKICAVYQKRRDVLIEGLKKGGWEVAPPRGSMFVWARIPEPFRNLGSLEFAKLLLEQALVAVSPGIGFGPLGRGLCGSRWSRTSSASGRRRGGFGRCSGGGSPRRPATPTAVQCCAMLVVA